MPRIILALLLAFVSINVDSAGTAAGREVLFSQERLSACGTDAPDGLILHLAYDAEGKLTDPPYALLNPTTGASQPIDVPDAEEAFSAKYGCLAFVKTVGGVFYIVNGSDGTSYPLDFMDPVYEWEYDHTAYWGTVGERPYALFASKDDRVIMLDLWNGTYSDLTPLVAENSGVLFAKFSPSSKYLVMDDGGMMLRREYLIPTADPSLTRLSSPKRFSSIDEFDATEERFLFTTLEGTTRDLYIQDVASGESRLVATDPIDIAEYDPYMTGWFIPGEEDLIAVLHHDRFALVDISGVAPVEKFVIDGHRPFSRFVVAPNGKSGVLDGKPETIFVDLETGESRVVTTEDGTGIRRVAAYDEHGIAEIGHMDEPSRGYGVINLETGSFTTIYLLGEGESFDHEATTWSTDGSTGLVTVVDANQQSHLILVNNESGTTQPLADAATIKVTLSPDGKWAAYSAISVTGPGPKPDLQLVETSTGTTTPLEPGNYPDWVWA